MLEHHETVHVGAELHDDRHQQGRDGVHHERLREQELQHARAQRMIEQARLADARQAHEVWHDLRGQLDVLDDAQPAEGGDALPNAERLAGLPAIELPGGLRVYEARTFTTRRDGLAELPELPPDWGLLIAPCRSIHTIGMRFALDLLWLDRDDAVLEVVRDVAPRRQRTALRARSVIEVAAGRGEGFAEAWSSRRASAR